MEQKTPEHTKSALIEKSADSLLANAACQEKLLPSSCPPPDGKVPAPVVVVHSQPSDKSNQSVPPPDNAAEPNQPMSDSKGAYGNAQQANSKLSTDETAGKQN